VPLIAEVEGEPVAGAVAFGLDDRVWYLHGMSTLEHREKMPTYAVQWEIMRWGKEQGCRVYDMWGAPDVFEREDPMWGVYRFKRGFGGEVVRTIGAWDYPVKPILYQLYNTLLPKVLNIMRWFGNRQTEEAAS
jgi:lipid II:glycine glycyltransferase (peptidoglycan interpeptide bridge formation enzyme)